jgi:hypothetical protein
MNRNQWISAMVVAVCVCTLSLGVFWPAGLDADGQNVQIQMPGAMLEVEGLKVTLTGNDGAIKEGNDCVLQLQAENVSDSPRRVELEVALSSPGEVSPLSRMMPVSQEVWREKVVLQLEPGQKVTRQLKPDVKINAKAQYDASLHSGDTAVLGWMYRPGRMAQQIGNGQAVQSLAVTPETQASQSNKSQQ